MLSTPSDPAMKEFILHTQEKSGQQFVIDADTDETHVVIKAEFVKFVRDELDKLMDSLSYDPVCALLAIYV